MAVGKRGRGDRVKNERKKSFSELKLNSSNGKKEKIYHKVHKGAQKKNFHTHAMTFPQRRAKISFQRKQKSRTLLILIQTFMKIMLSPLRE
ncbi:MAG: hypothetical protein A3F67_02790 [Verrucomicrobia bacterium RIFCSPHIGHO2_12_FULL_41_10]|nr:MAG: hypothetical protein A3F67_02790 [Verrucomicrobia bacterium RIFCSPHIGHO2_12_FULL_41_10]